MKQCMTYFPINAGILSQPGLLFLRELICKCDIIFIIIRYGHASGRVLKQCVY